MNLESEFCSYKLSLHENPIFFKTQQKCSFFITFIFYRTAVVKLDQYMALFLSYANTVLWWSRCTIHRYVAALIVHIFEDPVTISQRILQMHQLCMWPMFLTTKWACSRFHTKCSAGHNYRMQFLVYMLLFFCVWGKCTLNNAMPPLSSHLPLCSGGRIRPLNPVHGCLTSIPHLTVGKLIMRQNTGMMLQVYLGPLHPDLYVYHISKFKRKTIAPH